MKIAVDAMGGDHAPQNVLDGVGLFLQENAQVELLLVGDEPVLKEELKKRGLLSHKQLTVVHAPETINMGEVPVKAIRQKQKSSLCVAVDLVKNKQAEAVISAGNTGAMVAASTLKLRTLKDIDRPAIATFIPNSKSYNLLLDVGAVTDCKVKNYIQFGLMGSCIFKALFDVKEPKVGLLNVGEEEGKGDEASKEVFSAFKSTPLNFVGNVEGRDIFKDSAQVIVTNGFVGNIVLKACESLASSLFSVIREEIMGSWITKLGGLLIKSAVRRVKERFNHEAYGGALLLGIQGVVVIAHGSSSSYSFKNAFNVALTMVDKKINDQIVKTMSVLKSTSPSEPMEKGKN